MALSAWRKRLGAIEGQRLLWRLAKGDLLGPFFYAIICSRLSSLLRGRRRRAYSKKHWFLWVASHMRLVLCVFIFVIDPCARTLRFIEGAEEGGLKYFGICAGPDGMLYCAACCNYCCYCCYCCFYCLLFVVVVVVG